MNAGTLTQIAGFSVIMGAVVLPIWYALVYSVASGVMR